MSADPLELSEISNICSLPVLIGSGVTFENFHDFKIADGIIIGSYFKQDGQWRNKLSLERVQKFMELVNSCRYDVP